MPIQDIGAGSARYNNNKVRMSYIPPSIVNDVIKYCSNNDTNVPIRGLVMLAEHYSLGSAKYPDGPSVSGFTYPNWAKGQLFDSMLINSTLRHLYAYCDGEDYDLDFGSHHLIAVSWGIACLHHQFTNYEAYKQFDDRMWLGFRVTLYENLSEEAKWLQVLNGIQVIENPLVCATLLTEAFFSILIRFEIVNKENLIFTIDSIRLENIKNKNYGKPITVG